MALGSPQPLTAIAQGISGGLEKREERQRFQAEQGQKERGLQLQAQAGERSGRSIRVQELQQDQKILGSTLKRVRAIAQTDPEQANLLIQGFKNSETGAAVLERLGIPKELDFKILSNGQQEMSGTIVADKSNIEFLNSTGEQSLGTDPGVEIGDTVSMTQSPDKKVFEVEKIDKLSQQKKKLEIQKLQKKVAGETLKSFSKDEQKVLVDQQKILNTEVKKSVEQLKAAQKLQQLATSELTAADASLATFAAKVSGQVGVLTDRDVAIFGNMGNVRQKIENIVSLATSGLRSPENREFLIQLSTILENKLTEDVSAFKAAAINRSNSLGISGENVDKFFDAVIAPKIAGALEKDPETGLPSEFIRNRNKRLTDSLIQNKVDLSNQPQDVLQAIEAIKRNPESPGAAKGIQALLKRGVLRI